MGRKAQLQSSETIFVVFVIIIIVLLGMVFYARVQESNLKSKQREQRVLQLIALGHSISNWPELECSTLESREFDCIDRVKLGLISSFITQNKEEGSYAFRYYSDILRRSSITVDEVYSYQAPKSWVIYNNSGEGTKDSVQVPVNVYDPVEQTFTFAIMEISVYE